jgi:hypothetical protein
LSGSTVRRRLRGVDALGEPPPELTTRDWIHGILFVVLAAAATIATVIWFVLFVLNTPCCGQPN